MLPCFAKVIVKQRVAPLMLKFNFYDLHTEEKLTHPNAYICLHPLDPSPSIESHTKMLKVVSHSVKLHYEDYANTGKTWPEKDEATKTPVPQQVYVSVTSQTGCKCEVFASFPRERPSRSIKKKLQHEAKVKAEMAGEEAVKHKTERDNHRRI